MGMADSNRIDFGIADSATRLMTARRDATSHPPEKSLCRIPIGGIIDVTSINPPILRGGDYRPALNSQQITHVHKILPNDSKLAILANRHGVITAAIIVQGLPSCLQCRSINPLGTERSIG